MNWPDPHYPAGNGVIVALLLVNGAFAAVLLIAAIVVAVRGPW